MNICNNVKKYKKHVGRARVSELVRERAVFEKKEKCRSVATYFSFFSNTY
jgi:hypothetical protein